MRAPACGLTPYFLAALSLLLGCSLAAAGDPRLSRTPDAPPSAPIHLPDKTSPVLTVTEPAEAAVVMTPTITVRGTVADAGPVTLRVNGYRVPVDGIAFTAQVSLRQGLNRLEVEATDASGSRTRLIRAVRYEDFRHIQAQVQPVLVAAGLPDLGDVALAPDGELLVTAPQAGRIYGIPAEGGPPRLLQDHLRQPVGIAVAGDGSIFVAEGGSDRILRIAPDGTRQVILDQVDEPRGLALDSQGHLFLTARRWPRAGRDTAGDVHRGVVLRLDIATGAVQIVTDGLVAPTGIVVTLEGAEKTLWVVADRRRGEGEARGEGLFRITLTGGVSPIPGPHLWRPLAIARDALGSLWLTARREYSTPEDLDDAAEWDRGVLFKVSAEGVWQQFAAHVNDATGLAFAAQGDLLVVEGTRGRILRFRAPPPPQVETVPPTNAPTATFRGSAEPGAMIVARGPAGMGTAPVDPEGRFQVSLPLLPGQANWIDTFAIAAAGTGLASAPTRLTAIQDSIPPSLLIVVPPSNALTNGTPIPVRGQVSDVSGPVQVIVNETTVPVDATGGFATSLPLLEGPNELRTRAVDLAGNAATDTRSVILDTLPPAITVESPREGDLVPGATVTVQGSVRDLHLSATVTVNGREAPVSADGRFSPEVPFLTNETSITVAASDRAGNTASLTRRVVRDGTSPTVTLVAAPPNPTNSRSLTVSVAGNDNVTPAAQLQFAFSLDSETTFSAYGASVTVTYPEVPDGPHAIRVKARDQAGNESAPLVVSLQVDTLPPVIAVTAPSNGLLTNQSAVTVAGTITDASPITEVSVNGQGIGAAGTNFTYTLSLGQGVNAISVTAKDAAGNVGSASVTAILDVVPPAIALTVPTASFLINQRELTVSGTVTDGSGIKTLSVNGQAVSFSGSAFTQAVTLSEGANTITVVATDQAGNSATASMAGTLDTIPPTLVISTPAPGFRTNQSALPVRATVSDASAIASVRLNGQAVPLVDGGFSQTAALVDGPNTVTVTATDAAGNTGTAVVTGMLDTVSPVITITTPTADATLNASPLLVSGIVSEAVASLTVNGIAASLSGAMWSLSLVPSPGRNTLTISATDLASNGGTTSRSFTFDDVAPILRILTPPSGQILGQTRLTVTGSVDDPMAGVNVNGVRATVQGGLFTASDVPASPGTLVITAEATDPAGNVGSTQVTVTVDNTPPTITTLTVPAEVAAGTAVTLSAEAADNLAISTLDLLVDGHLVASGTAFSVATTFTIPPDRAVNDSLTVTARVVDVAGIATTQISSMRVTSAAVGPGFLRGLVLDDPKGLPLAGATVTVTGTGTTPVDPRVTDSDGLYAFTLEPGTVLVRVTKDGATTVQRKVPVRSDLLSVVPDARLTPRDTSAAVIGSSGGIAADQANTLRFSIPAAAVMEDVSLTITPISDQGLMARLPLGWSPILIADIAPAILSLNAPGTLSVRLPEALESLLPAASPVTIARYDPSQGAWTVLDPGSLTTDGLAIEAALNAGGQVAFLLPDPAPQAPPAAVAGQLLAGLTAAAIPEDATATGSVTPGAIPPGAATVQGQVSVTSVAPLPSGTLVQAVVSEQYSLLSGEQVTPPSFTQDLVLYQSAIRNSQSEMLPLSAAFPVTPSKTYTLKDLAVGTVHVGIQTPDTGGQGTIIGPEGGTLTASDGTILTIPAGALARETVVALAPLAESDLRVAVPAGFQVLKAITLDLTRATLALSAELAFPLTGGIASDTQILVARVLEVDGVLKLQAVAVGQVSGALLSSKGTVTGVSLPGITQGGTYVALRGTTPVGYVAGTITDSNGTAKSGVVVASGTGLVDVSRSDGRYLVAAGTGSVTITATDRGTGQGASQAVSVASGTGTSQPLQVQVIPPTVVNVNPVTSAKNVPVTSQVTVTFSQAIAKTSLSPSTLILSGPSGPIDTTITLSPLGTDATLYPSKALAPQTRYTLVASQGILDTHGVPLSAPFTTQFTTANAPPPPPPAGAITVSFPDEQGNVTVTATQGTATPDTLTVVINTESGSIASASVRPDGSFTTSLFAQLGDELLVVLRDEAGRQTVASAGAYVHPDGRRIVTAAGGSIPVAGGATLTLAPQAVTMPTTLRTSVVDPTELPIALPPGYRVLPGLRIEMDRPLKIGARLRVPLPQDLALSSYARPFLARTQVIAGEMALVMVDSMRVLNNELTTSSPPFDGPGETGTYHAVIPSLPTPVLLQGTVTTTLPNGSITPVPGILIRVTDNPQVVTTKADGSFAIYAYPTSFETQPLTVTAIDPVTGTSRSASISMRVVPSGPVVTYRIDFELPGGLQLADTTPPTLTLALSGPGIKGSTIPLGTEAKLTVTATDNRAVSDGTATILLNGRALGLGINPGNTYSAQFVADTIGLAHLEAQVADTSGNIGRVLRLVQVIDPATRPGPLAGAPVVLETRPAKDSAVANVFDQLYVRFSEPVRNLTAETVRLEKLDANGVPAGSPIPLLLSPDVPDSTMDLFLYPQQNLEFTTRYRLTLTAGIHDQDAEPEGTHLAANDIRDFATVGLTKLPEKLVSDNLRAVEALDETRLVLLDRREGLRVVDVTDPSNPKPFGEFTRPWGGYYIGFQALKVVSDFAYKSWNGAVVKTPVAVVVGYISLPGEPIAGNLAVVNLAFPAAPRVIGRAVLGVETNAVPMDVLVKGSYAVVGSLAAGVQIVDLDKAIDEYACQLVAGSSCVGKPRDVTAGPAIYEDPLLESYGFGAQPIAAPFGLVASKKDPNTAYVAERSRGIYRLDLGGLPYLDKRLLFAIPAFHLALAEDVPRSDGGTADLLILATSQGLSVLNLTDPSVPPATLSDGLETGIFGITAHPGHGLAFVTSGTGGLAVVDVRAQRPTVVGTATGLGFANGSVTVNDQFAYVAAAGTGLEIVKYHPEGITLDLVDALAFKPWGDPANGLQGFLHAPASDMVVDQEMRREGALADGASLLVLRVKVPPYGIGEEPVDLRLAFTLSDPTAPSGEAGSAEALGSLYDGMSGWPLFSDPNVNGGPTQATIVIPTTPKKGGIGAIIYRPPTAFVRDAFDKIRVARPIQVTMAFDAAQVRDVYTLRSLKETTELVTGSKPLTAQFSLVRPPLLLVHGILSSSEGRWRALNNALLAELPRAFVFAPADYADRNHSGLESAYTAVRDTIKNTLENLRQGTIQEDSFNLERLLGFKRIAATRLDLLAHSMGGNATRYYIGETSKFRRADNYFFGDLRRIITVGTPYKGAAIARWVDQTCYYDLDNPDSDLIRDVCRKRSETDPARIFVRNVMGKGDMLGFRDLTPGSVVQRRFEQEREADPGALRGPRVHVIIGKANSVIWSQDNIVSVLAPRGLIPLPGARSDLIVCAQSQQGARLVPTAITTLDDVTHTMEGGSSDLVSRARELLNDKDGNDKFGERGMPPWADVSLDVPWQFTCPAYQP